MTSNVDLDLSNINSDIWHLTSVKFQANPTFTFQEMTASFTNEQAKESQYLLVDVTTKIMSTS